MTWLLHETVVNPQGVEHSIIAKFTGKYEQLITSIRNQFVCYDITPQGLQVRCKEVTEANIIQIGNVEVNHVMMLVLLFKEAKVSVLRYDETNNKFVIHSLHCFELPLKRMQEGLTPTTYTDPRLLIDKRGRCISLICYDRLMWVIPLGLDKTSYSINLEKFGINRIIDCIVLDGYDLPSVAFLHMKIPTWEGRIVNTGETTNEIIILSLEPDVIHERQDIVATISYQFSYVPYNALQIVDCYPTNGLLILTVNSIIYLSTTSFESFILPFGKFFVIPKNINGPLSSFQILQMQTKIMNSVKSIFKLTNHLYIIFSMNGESYYVHLLSIANRICDVIITNSPYKYHPTTFTISSNHLFIGSTVHDSYIYNYEIVEYGKGKQHEISQHINQEIRSKNLLFRHNEMEEEYPFDEPQPVSIPQELTVEFPQLDYIVSICNVHEYTLLEEENNMISIVLCCGIQPFSKIVKLSRSIQPENIMGVKESECFYKNDNIEVNKNGIFLNSINICSTEILGSIKRVKKEDDYLIIEQSDSKWCVFDINKKEIIIKEEGINELSFLPSSNEMEEEGEGNNFIKLKDGKVYKGEMVLEGIGERISQWVKEETKKGKEVVDIECVSIIEGKIDLIIITKEGILCYYRSMNDKGKFERLKVEAPQTFNCSIKPHINRIEINNKKHYLINGNCSYFIEYNYYYPIVIPFSIKVIKEVIVLNNFTCYLDTDDGKLIVKLNKQNIDKYPLPFTRIDIQGTPHHLVSYKNKLFVTVSFTTVLDTPDCPPQLPHSSNNQQEEPPVLEAQPLNSDVLLERYRIINLTTNDYYEFKKGQFICTAKLLKFKVGKQLKNYLVVGVNKQTTEDNPVKGKTYIFNIENQIQLINKIGDGKKSVHAVNEIGGFLAVASGNELELIERVDETRWIKKCFSDISILINSIEYLPLKVMERGNEKECYLILLSDFYRSVVLLLFKPYDYTVIPLGKDARNIHCIDSTFIITKDYFSVLEFDSEQNLSLLNYSSAATEQLSIFEIDATFNLGMNLLKFTRLWNGKGYIYMYVTVEGSVGYISVVEEKIYQVLRQINIKMNREPWHFAGTNAEEYRFEKGYGMGFGTRKHVFLDGDMLKQFRLLNEEQQKRVCLRNTSINDVFKLLSTGLQYNTFLQYNN
ncbi:hypothetical protein ENUP19_0241G0027 [Entamoeba nuttalli]|uniref:RSE1/DDB1/CPSF1 C-terminal domain-containing protein n=1 Tax=Entamoeba nuttalli TaxID=412467 RepID=A0ABQ0DQQ7_9EUKA